MTVPNEETVTPEMTPTPEPLAALVNGEAITLADFERQVASYEATMSASGFIMLSSQFTAADISCLYFCINHNAAEIKTV